MQSGIDNRTFENNISLGIISEMIACPDNGKIYMADSMGRIIDVMSRSYKQLVLCIPVIDKNKERFIKDHDYYLNMKNIQLFAQPSYGSMLSSLKHPLAIIKAYSRSLRKGEHIFVRGMLPYVGVFYFLARWYNRKPVHWIVGDPISLLRSHRRSNWAMDTMCLMYAYQDRFFTRFGRWLTGGALVCNGRVLASQYASSRTRDVVSSTVSDNEFFPREDTCNNDELRILFVGYIRPEKGVEYLIEAMSRLRSDRPWRLTIIGSWNEFKEYKIKLTRLIQELKLEDRIDWKGYIPYGPQMRDYFQQHDIFILPTLSEGTPHVLTESRANGLPVITTPVGGIPSMVTNEFDGLLVPPKDPDAIAMAIERIVDDPELRRKLVQNGLVTAKKMTIEQFVGTVMNCLKEEI